MENPNADMFNSSLVEEILPIPQSLVSSQVFCLLSKPNIYIFKAFHAINIAQMLPLCLFLLHHGVQQKRQKTSSTATISHSDCFAYHMVSMEMIGVFGSLVILIAANSVQNVVNFSVYSCMAILIWHGQTLFHLLTCVERYLAVVHAIVYMRLKNGRGIKIRNISISCVWLCCITSMSLFKFYSVLFIVDFCLVVCSLAVVSFCSSTVLRILVRPGPGEQNVNRDKLNQSKQRALYTIVSIFGALLLRFSGSTIWIVVQSFYPHFSCEAMMVGMWFQLPSSLVLPLLYLHRAGKLGNCSKAHT